MDKTGGKAVSQYSVEIFFLAVLRNFVEKPFCVPEISCVPENFMDIKEERRVYQDLLSRKYCLTVPKIFAEEQFSALFRKTSSSEKAFA